MRNRFLYIILLFSGGLSITQGSSKIDTDHKPSHSTNDIEEDLNKLAKVNGELKQASDNLQKVYEHIEQEEKVNSGENAPFTSEQPFYNDNFEYGESEKPRVGEFNDPQVMPFLISKRNWKPFNPGTHIQKKYNPYYLDYFGNVEPMDYVPSVSTGMVDFKRKKRASKTVLSKNFYNPIFFKNPTKKNYVTKPHLTRSNSYNNKKGFIESLFSKTANRPRPKRNCMTTGRCSQSSSVYDGMEDFMPFLQQLGSNTAGAMSRLIDEKDKMHQLMNHNGKETIYKVEKDDRNEANHNGLAKVSSEVFGKRKRREVSEDGSSSFDYLNSELSNEVTQRKNQWDQLFTQHFEAIMSELDEMQEMFRQLIHQDGTFTDA